MSKISKRARMILREAAEDNLEYRQFSVRADTVNDTDRSVTAVVAAETPVMEYDYSRDEYVPRILLTEGAQFPSGGQVPLLDSHSRWSVKDQLGSVRNLQRKEDGVQGKLSFSSTADGEFTKVKERHITDVSAGFRVLKEVYVGKGDTREIKGKKYTGPVNVATAWRLYEVSLVPIGADQAAKIRAERQSTFHSPQKEVPVNPELRKRCEAAGMDPGLDDVKAMEWLNSNHARVFGAKPEDRPQATVTVTTQERNDPPPASIDPTKLASDVSRTVLEEMENRRKAQEKHDKEQREAFERDANATLELMFGSKEEIPSDVSAACLRMGKMDDVRSYLTEYRKKTQERTGVSGGFSSFQHTESQRDKHREMIQSAFLVRSYDTAFNGRSKDMYKEDQRAKGYDQFSGMRLVDLARECLMADGYNWNQLRNLSPEQLAKAALGWPEKCGLRSAGYAYHTTGSLAVITQDAINKTLLAAYQETPSTWRGPMRQAASVADFKQIHRIKLSATGNLPVWPDNRDPEQAALSNEEEKYAVEARALMLSLSWRLLVNDDMDALARTPALLGNSAARTVNTVAWAALLANPTMADGQALFLAAATGARYRSNLTTGSATPTTATLAAMKNKMRQMRGLNTPEGLESKDILNLMPRYIVAPSALENTVLTLINSIADPAGSHTGVWNSARTLVPVIEPLLDANSATAWYLFADPASIDTCEVTFLQGQETPVTNDWVDEKTLSRNFNIIQTYASRPIDFRGIQKHAGA